MRESNIQTLLGQKLRETKFPYPICIELKLEKTNTFAFNKVKDHQLYYLHQAKEGLYHKIPDMAAINGFTGSKPFDCMWMVTPYTYVVICFYKPRKEKMFYFIWIDDFITLRNQCLPRKSVTRDILDSSPLVSLIVSSSDSWPHKLCKLTQQILA